MDTLHVTYLLVGGGGAGSAAAEAIRRLDPISPLLLVGQESSRPYIRPALSKEYLRREKPRQELAIDLVGWYAQKHVELRTGRRVAHLDTSRKTVTLDSGEEVAYDKLLLALGGTPRPLRVPGAELPNVFYLRTLDDADRLLHAIDKARGEGRPQPSYDKAVHGGGSIPRGRAVVIGSGLLAVEVAASLRQVGLHVELVSGPRHPWGKFAGENTGKFIARYLENRGIIVHPLVAVERLEGDGRVQRVIISGGEAIACDFVVPALGMVVNRELLRGTPIAAEKAILVDECCRTNVPDVYAAGDCAAIYDPLFGKHRLLDHWDSARATGTLAGENMAGADLHRYSEVSSFFSEVFDLELKGWGEGRFVDRRLVRGTPNIDSPDFAEIGVSADGRVAQVLAVGRAAEHELFRQMVARRLQVDGNEELIKDPARELREILDPDAQRQR